MVILHLIRVPTLFNANLTSLLLLESEEESETDGERIGGARFGSPGAEKSSGFRSGSAESDEAEVGKEAAEASEGGRV